MVRFNAVWMKRGLYDEDDKDANSEGVLTSASDGGLSSLVWHCQTFQQLLLYRSMAWKPIVGYTLPISSTSLLILLEPKNACHVI